MPKYRAADDGSANGGEDDRNKTADAVLQKYTSIAKMTPAIGVLKEAEIALATPAAARIRKR